MIVINKTYLKDLLPDILVSLLWAILFLLYYGYAFNNADQAEHLPSVYNLINPALYPADYFVTSAEKELTVRYFYIQLVSLSGYIMPVSWFCFIATVVSLSISVFATIRIGRHWMHTNFVGLFVPLFVYFIFYNYWSIGANHIASNIFISDTPALALGLLGLLLFFKRKILLAFALFGIAAMFQVLWGLYFFGCVFLLVLFSKNIIRKAFLGAIIFFLFASPMLFIVLKQQLFSSHFNYNLEHFYTIMYRYRGYHHYLPSLFPITHYIKFSMLIVGGMVSAILLGIRQVSQFFKLILFFVVGFALYYFSIEVFSLYFIGKTQFAKFSVIISLLMSICCGLFVAKTCSQFLEIKTLKRKIYLPVVSVLCILSMLFLTNSKWFYKNDQKIKYQIGNFHPSQLHKMHVWIAKNTNPDAVFLVAPNNDSFQSQAKRSLLTGYRAIVHTSEFLMPWFKNFTQIYGIYPDKNQRHNMLPVAVKSYYKNNRSQFIKLHYNVQYRLDNINTCKYADELGTVVHKELPWILTRM